MEPNYENMNGNTPLGHWQALITTRPVMPSGSDGLYCIWLANYAHTQSSDNDCTVLGLDNDR